MLKQSAKLLFVSILIACILAGCLNFPIHTPQPVDTNQLSQPTEIQPDASPPSNALAEPQVTYPGLGTNTQNTYPMDNIPTSTSIEQLQPPASAPAPDKDRAAVSGLLYAFDISVVVTNKIFYLSPALMIDGKPVVSPIITSPSVENGDIVATTDANGKFEINNITPGYYYLMVNYPDHTVIGLSSPNTSQILLISLEAGSSVPLGIVFVER